MTWVDVCPLDRLVVDRGVAALVGGEPVALFRLWGDELYAIDHCEPFTGAPVMARGLVGSAGGTPTVASPLHKERFDLRTGGCLDAPGRSVRTWPVRVTGGVVQVADRPAPRLNGHHRLNGVTSAADSRANTGDPQT
jgi:nitrite reductase (NADH) small subunit